MVSTRLLHMLVRLPIGWEENRKIVGRRKYSFLWTKVVFTCFLKRAIGLKWTELTFYTLKVELKVKLLKIEKYKRLA